MSDLMRGLPREGWAIRKPDGEHIWRYFVTNDRSLRAICLTRRGAIRYIRRQIRAEAKPIREWWNDPPIITERDCP